LLQYTHGVFVPPAKFCPGYENDTVKDKKASDSQRTNSMTEKGGSFRQPGRVHAEKKEADANEVLVPAPVAFLNNSFNTVPSTYSLVRQN
jgi:hypothetical protein